jgi:isocitrate dehydrogenase
MTTPLVEMDGDEMTRVLWQMIKDRLLLPFIDLKTEYYDLGLLNRNKTGDQVTVDAAHATKRLGVGVKCATITPNRQRMVEYPELTEMWKSPNATIRSILNGTIFRAPITLGCIQPVVRNWEKPITIARHAYGDVYAAVETQTDEPGECTLTFKGADGTERQLTVRKVDGPTVWQGMHNTEESIRSFAKSVLYLCDRHPAGPVVFHEGHDLENLRRPVQSNFRGGIRKLQGRFRAAGHRVLLHAHRRRGGPRHALEGRLYLGS